MKDALTGVRPLVDNEPVAAVRQTKFFGDVARREEDLSQRPGVLHGGVVDSWDVALRNDEDVHRRHRADVLECDHVIVLENDVRGRFSEHDVAEETAGHGERA